MLLVHIVAAVKFAADKAMLVAAAAVLLILLLVAVFVDPFELRVFDWPRLWDHPSGPLYAVYVQAKKTPLTFTSKSAQLAAELLSQSSRTLSLFRGFESHRIAAPKAVRRDGSGSRNNGNLSSAYKFFHPGLC